MAPVKIYDLPDPWPYQLFPLMIEEESGRLMYCTGLSIERRNAIEAQFRGKLARFGDYVMDRIDGVFEHNDVEYVIRREWPNLDPSRSEKLQRQAIRPG